MAFVRFKRDYYSSREDNKYDVYGARDVSRKSGDNYNCYYDESYTELLIYQYGEFRWEEASDLEPYEE